MAGSEHGRLPAASFMRAGNVIAKAKGEVVTCNAWGIFKGGKNLSQILPQDTVGSWIPHCIAWLLKPVEKQRLVRCNASSGVYRSGISSYWMPKPQISPLTGQC
ncbi:MAG: hypothetical protein M8364_11720 [Methylobacter sp.]|uniref:hypothetical protein n=1 Tax=Methylobacter sp. TaxID=2051955 RepID=UPI00258687B9|nr:hypothetical protein [Methylobacter sp.]MCL7421561.1 hypothetical protein [Methylobacter sp.]